LLQRTKNYIVDTHVATSALAVPLGILGTVLPRSWETGVS